MHKARGSSLRTTKKKTSVGCGWQNTLLETISRLTVTAVWLRAKLGGHERAWKEIAFLKGKVKVLEGAYNSLEELFLWWIIKVQWYFHFLFLSGIFLKLKSGWCLRRLELKTRKLHRICRGSYWFLQSFVVDIISKSALGSLVAFRFIIVWILIIKN